MKKSIVVLFVVFLSVFLSLSTLHSFLGRVQAQNIPDIDRQQSLPIEMIHQQGGSTFDVALQGDYAFVGVGPRLLILNVVDAANPVLVSKTDVFSGVVTNVTVDNQHVYLSAGGDLAIVDVQDVVNPVVTAVYDMPGYAKGIVITGTTAFIAEVRYWYGGQHHGGGLYTLDISDPAHPALLDHFETSASANDVALSGDVAYVAVESLSSSTTGLVVCDISNPSAITQTNFIATPIATAVTVAGNELYIATQDNGVGIFDITNPTTPTLYTYHTGWSTEDVTVANNVAYVAGSIGGLLLIDVTSPSSPTNLGNYDVSEFDSARALKVAVNGDQAFVAYDPIGLHIVDVSDSMNPVKTAVYNPTGWVRTITKNGDRLYLSEAENGLHILNTDDLSEVGFYSKAPIVFDLVILGNYAHFVNESGLHILDVSNTTSVTETGYLTFLNTPLRLKVDGHHAYVAAGYGSDGGMRVIDVSSPATPVEVGAFAGAKVDYVNDLAISDTLAYLADSDNGLKIVDISDVTNPSELGSINVGYIENIEIYSHYAYAFDWQNLYVVDVSNPATPTAVITQTITDDSICNTLLANGYLYVTEEGGGMHILDLANPVAPVEVFATDLAGYPFDVAVDNGTVYVAASEAGFYIFGEPITITNFIYLPTIIRGE